MLWLNFDRWNYAAGRVLTSKRLRIKGYKWTPFVILRLRKY